MSVLGNHLSGGGAFLKWETPGTSYTGTIANVELRQARKFESTDLAFWDDGSPQMQCLLTLDTDYRDGAIEDDEGVRMLSINLWSGQKKALISACRAAGVDEPQIGQRLTVTHKEGIGNAKNPRVFEYVLAAGPSGVATALVEPAAPVAAPAAAPMAQAAAAVNPVDTAKALLATGAMSTTDIAQATGLPETVIAALANVVAAGL